MWSKPSLSMSQARRPSVRPSSPGRLASPGIVLGAGEENKTTVSSALMGLMKGSQHTSAAMNSMVGVHSVLYTGARGAGEGGVSRRSE